MKEETDLSVKIEKQLNPNIYSFYWDPTNSNVRKKVYCFLAKSNSKKFDLRKDPDPNVYEEFKGAKWLPPKTAIRLVKHKSEKEILREAYKFLSKK